jgi:pimeloyl-ACP methyl ester carboxylesterase
VNSGAVGDVGDREAVHAFCYRAADFYLPADEARKAPTRARFLELVRQAYGICPDQYHAVPYPGGALPACRLGQPHRGSMLITGGFDGYLEDRFAMMSAVARAGYQVIALDGPGQGAALEDHGLVLTPDWQHPVAAVLDHFGLAQATLIGISLGGCLAIRAAAAEPRIIRVVADDVLTDLAECNRRQLAPPARTLVATLLRLRADRLLDTVVRRQMRHDLLSDWGIRQGQHVLGVPTPHAYLRSAGRFVTADVSGRVRADVLLLAGTADHYVPARQLTDQITALTSARSVTARIFTEQEQAGQHCQYGNLALAIQVILDWLDGLDERDHRLAHPARSV